MIFLSRMTFKFDGWPGETIGHLSYATSFNSHPWIQTGVTVRKRPIWVKISDFLSRVTLEFDWQWLMTLKNNRAPLLCYLKLCATFHSHRWIKTGVTLRKCQIWVKIINFFVPYDLEIWRMTLKNNRALLLCYFKLCATFQSSVDSNWNYSHYLNQ